ncbi:MAG TPA: class I SAM-dependent methyltransferase [Pyrinomonadaceae bacterium]|jgi:SAM-dependent methyltransferase|nr:class I SAM-dependent methyltransferase [Pyrinomonadaceae bacterium]
MDEYTAATYGEQCADVYDDWHGDYDEAAVGMLAELARGGRVLELGVGTGRIALPLAAKGIDIQGIDASPAMVAKLDDKPGGERVPVSIGDFADVEVEGEFSLIFIVFNTFFLLLTQEEQVRCFRNVARRLSPGGVFLVEAFVPDLTRFTDGQNVKAVEVTTDHINLDIARHDSARQHVTGHKVVLTDGRVRIYPIQIRYAWPSELDLMAQLAGLRLRERRGGWRGERFNSASGKHVSIYERAA